MGVIREFYYGNLEPQTGSFNRSSSFAKTLKQLSDNELLLNDNLSDEDKQLFEAYIKAQSEILSISEEDSFENGFRLATKLLLDALYGKSEQFKENRRIQHGQTN